MKAKTGINRVLASWPGWAVGLFAIGWIGGCAYLSWTVLDNLEHELGPWGPYIGLTLMGVVLIVLRLGKIIRLLEDDDQ